MSNYITYEEFEAKYSPVANPRDCDEVPIHYNDDGEGVAYGYCYKQDIKHVMAVADSTPNKVWTMVDSETFDGIVIVPGYRLVNRIGYLITEVPFTNEEFVEGLAVKYWESDNEEEAMVVMDPVEVPVVDSDETIDTLN